MAVLQNVSRKHDTFLQFH